MPSNPGGSGSSTTGPAPSPDTSEVPVTPALLDSAGAGDPSGAENVGASSLGDAGAATGALAVYFRNQLFSADGGGGSNNTGSGNVGEMNPFTNAPATTGASGPFVGRDVESFTGTAEPGSSSAFLSAPIFEAKGDIPNPVTLDTSPEYPSDHGRPDAERAERDETPRSHETQSGSQTRTSPVRSSPIGAASLLEKVEALIRYEKSIEGQKESDAVPPSAPAAAGPLQNRPPEVRPPPTTLAATASAMANPVPPQSANIAVPDWTTRTEWAPSETKYGWIRPITSLDTGNRPLNVLLNKVVLPWSNLAAALIDAPIAMLREVDDRLKHSRFSVEYEAAPYVFPADGVFEFGAEAGPAIEYGLAWISSSRRLRNLATAPAYWFLSAGGIGGSSLGRRLAAGAGKTIEEAGALKAGDGLKALDTGPGKVLRTFEAGANMADSAANFELAKAGTESGTGYFLDGVQFEGYENRALVDAKAWSDTGRMSQALRNQEMWAGWKVVNQAARQLAVARAHGLSVEWRFLGQETAEIVQEILRINGLDIRIVY